MDTRPSPFAPPHCPNPSCPFHLDPSDWSFSPAGTHSRQSLPHIVPRFRCRHCGRSFSSQTFSPTYWLKRPELLERVFAAEVNGSGHRQIGRQFEAAHSTVQRHVERLGRHCLLYHETFRDAARDALITEPVVLDGLRTFAGSQYWILEISGLIGARSCYSHGFVVTERRRSGSMTEIQVKRRNVLEQAYGRPDPSGLKKDVVELLEASLPRSIPEGSTIVLRSDDEPAYTRALKEGAPREIEHQTTPSTAPRTPRNPLFPINAHHMLMRHSAANLKRETIAFSKRIQAVIYRHAIFQIWVNHVKSAAERDPRTGRAERLRLASGRRKIADLLKQRIFPTRMTLCRRVADYYWSRVKSRFLENERGHDLKYAF
jgi:transposase-like protein